MTRPLTPAARAVLATVRAACRAGRVDLADQADGTTLVVVLSDDGADLLRAVVRAVARVADAHQLALPGVPVVPPPVVVPQPIELDPADLVPPRASKPRPARRTAEPAADALAVRGQRCVVAVVHEGGPWELIWSDEMPGQMVHDDAWRAVQEQAARARRYNRGSRCVADTADGRTS